MAGRLEGKVAVVTGGTRGIGQSAAELMVAQGARVVICGRDTKGGKAVEEKINKNGRNAVYVEADVSDYGQLEKVFQAAMDEFGKLDILFNNAGTGSFGETPDVEIEEWKRMIEVDLNAPFYGCKIGIPLMRKSGGGSIINNSSMSGMFGEYGLPAYCAAKGGIINFTRVLAMDHGKDGIRANCVCPGFIKAVSNQVVLEYEHLKKELISRIPAGRVGRAEDIGNVVVFLASDEAAFLTGQAIIVDGGMTASTNLPDIKEAFM